MNLFEILNERYVLPPKPKLFESFAGIGCQRMAFDRLGIDYESVGISEIDKYAVMSYASIHCGLGREIGKLQKEIKREILEKAKENGAKKKPKRLKKKVSELSDKEKYAIANRLSKNYGDITKIHGYQLPTIDVFTFSFPCTDLSRAGKQKGLNATRSGLVYEVLRILQELKDLHNLPNVLIMENVVDLVQTKFIREFNEIQLELEGLGYLNYVETMNAKDYGVAQNRDRVFMVSILGDYYYEFPKKIKLEKRLKDYLESEVDEKYYLSEKAMEFALNRPANYENKIDADISNTLRTNYGNAYANECYVSVAGNVNPSGNGMNGNVYQGDLSPTLTTNKGEGIKIVEPVICASRGRENGQEIEVNKSGLSNALTTVQKDNMVVEPFIEVESLSGPIRAYEGDGVIASRPHQTFMPVVHGTSHCIRAGNASDSGVVQNLRIRKLTPLECWRLMGIDDECFYKASEVNSNSQLYKQAGNGIVIDVFAAIIKNLKGNYEIHNR